MRRLRKTKKFIVAFGTFLLAAFALGGFALASLIKDLPNPAKLEERKIVESTKIYDRSGEILLFEIHGEEKRTMIPFEKIPPAVKNAAIALEDANFYKHRGIDFRGVARAFLVDVFSGNLQQGGSTITQQLIKNLLLGKERTIKRKIKEAALSVLLESRYSKDEILHLYLNQIPYGSNAYGIEAAADTFFGTSTESLTLTQAALLSALPKAPTYYSPYGGHVEELLSRKNFALTRMRELGYISPKEEERAQKEKIVFLPQKRAGVRAPHFVMYVRELLIHKYGEEVVEEGGLKVVTSLDMRLQEEAEKIVKEGAEFNKKAIAAHNAALVAIDPKNGEILTMVGSKDYWEKPEPEGCSPGSTCRFDPQVNIVLRNRQPGSAFKPFVYATAFQKGYTPDTVLFDVPTEFNPQCSPDGEPTRSDIKKEDCYHPGNYDEKFRGPVTIRQALAQSLNIPSAKLLYLAGIEDSIKTAESMGITTLKDRSRFGLSLVLGGAEVKLLEMTSAFSAFATDGILNPPSPILKIEQGGKIVEEKRVQPVQVVDTEVARTINDVLSDDEARFPVFQLRGSLWLPGRPVAAKTGTTQEFRDAWTVGYTPSLAVGVWSGNNDNTPMQQKGSGVLAAAPIWNKFMRFAAQSSLPGIFVKPDIKKSSKPVLNGLWQGEQILKIDKISRKLATDLTPEETTEETAFGNPHDPLFWINKNDPGGPPLDDPLRDSQYKNWEEAFQRWLKSSDFVSRPISSAPIDFDDVHTAETKPKITLEKLEDNGQNYTFVLNISSSFPIKEINATVFDILVATARPNEGKAAVTISKERLGNPPAPVVIKVYDSGGNQNEMTIPFGATN